MGNPTAQSNISKILMNARQASLAQNAYIFLPEIITLLEAIQSETSLSKERRNRMAGGLGRLVTDDINFAESPLGISILRIADDFAAGG